MSSVTATIYLLAALIAALWIRAIAQAADAWWRLGGGTRLIACPETGLPAAVRLDLPWALATAVFDRPVLSLSDCSRWPARALCDQACLGQVRAAPAATRLRAQIDQWCAGRRCAACQRSIKDAVALDHHPALLLSDGTTSEWTDIPPERLPALFRDHAVLCWNCHVAEMFRRTHPELVTDRSNTTSCR